MPVQKLKQYLDSNSIKFVSITHSTAYTAQEVAASTHTPGKELAKTVMVKINGTMAMVVLPSSYQIDFHLLKKATGANTAELAEEDDFRSLFPECEVGAMPPFGNLYGMDVYVAEALTDDEEIAFNAGTHTELIRLKYDDFQRLVKPRIIRISVI
ncbi:aminoacyl-tRNA deacylase [Candidatus Latescibacterota bacterium]